MIKEIVRDTLLLLQQASRKYGISYAVKYVTVTKLNTKLKERLKEF